MSTFFDQLPRPMTGPYANAVLLVSLLGLLCIAILRLGNPKSFGGVFRDLSQIIQDYQNHKFYLPFGLGERGLVKVVDKRCFQELSEATELSQRAVYSDLFSFKQNLHGFKGEEQKIARTRLFGRVLQVQGPPQLKALDSLIETSIRKSFDDAIRSSIQSTDAVSVNLAELSENIVFEVFSTYFFGPALGTAREAGFRSAALQHPRDLVNTLIVAKLLPKFLRPTMVNYITRGGRAGNDMRARLIEIINDQTTWPERPEIKQFTMLESMISSTKGDDYWTAEGLTSSIMGIWLAASFQPWVNLHFIVLKLCECPDYIEILRNELAQQTQRVSIANVEDLPILDSFVKEVFRTQPLDHLSVRRKALRPFQFSNGQRVAVGEIACIPSIDRMRDASAYPNPLTFDGRRFVQTHSRPALDKRNIRLTDVSEDFLSWGYGSLACPGRFLASSVMKAILVHLLTHYDMELERRKGPVSWTWESFEMPSKDSRVIMRPRSAAA